jgi:hypothetical protein
MGGKYSVLEADAVALGRVPSAAEHPEMIASG